MSMIMSWYGNEIPLISPRSIIVPFGPARRGAIERLRVFLYSVKNVIPQQTQFEITSKAWIQFLIDAKLYVVKCAHNSHGSEPHRLHAHHHNATYRATIHVTFFLRHRQRRLHFAAPREGRGRSGMINVLLKWWFSRWPDLNNHQYSEFGHLFN